MWARKLDKVYSMIGTHNEGIEIRAEVIDTMTSTPHLIDAWTKQTGRNWNAINSATLLFPFHAIPDS